ncbi:hypothetical protein DRW41_15640 [Neobacillus piezotolerans]|uniref:Uncharacterized protein n=1 Tax=Neobacillus piezotolerans TaxID=2259171 RepID=A0A3D8GNG9_9BACI|nr:hypothetical protein [Neobacillus piezotolerans]RDU36020.1 hypothetical protein DRW41_15640 [Neobacillus piezotolerans]
MGRKFHRENFEEEFEFENVAGIFEEEDFRRPIRSRNFCREVRRCLIEDLLAAENRRRRRRRHRCRS